MKNTRNMLFDHMVIIIYKMEAIIKVLKKLAHSSM